MFIEDSQFTKTLIKKVSTCKCTGISEAINAMSSVEGRTALLGTALFVINYGAYLITEGSPMEGVALFMAGALVIYTRELLFDVKYNGSGNIVDALLDNRDDDDK